MSQTLRQNGPFGFQLANSGANSFDTDANFALLSTLLTPQYNAVSGNTPLTLLAAKIAGAQEVTVNLTAALAGAGTVTTDTAANIIAAIPVTLNGSAVGVSFRLRIINSSSGAFAWTVAGGTGVTITGTATIAQNTWREFIVTVTGAATVTLQSIGTGTFS
jgi:hypothetical protein